MTTQYDEELLTLKPGTEEVIDINFDAELPTGAAIASVVFTIEAVHPSTATSLTKDTESIRTLPPYNSRTVQVRLITASDGYGEYRLTITPTTNESPEQRTPKFIPILIEA